MAHTHEAVNWPFVNLLDVSPMENFTDEYIGYLRAAGLSVQVQCASKRHEEFSEAIVSIAKFRSRIALSPDLALVLTQRDLDGAREAKKLGIILHMDRVQLPRMIDGAYIRFSKEHFAGLQAMFDAGIRVSQLVYYSRTIVGDGCGEPSDAGLSQLGREVVKAMNEVGLVIDLAHASRRTCLDAIETSNSPCIFSHGGARAICDTPRNMDDETIKLLAQAGGVFGICMFSPQIVAVDAKFRQATLDDWLDHVDHVAGLVGIDHVAFGPDSMSGDPAPAYAERLRSAFPDIYPPSMPYANRKVVGMERPDAYPMVWSALRNRGYREEDVQKVMGENALRVIGRALPA